MGTMVREWKVVLIRVRMSTMILMVVREIVTVKEKEARALLWNFSEKLLKEANVTTS